jgi:hypothetical protein
VAFINSLIVAPWGRFSRLRTLAVLLPGRTPSTALRAAPREVEGATVSVAAALVTGALALCGVRSGFLAGLGSWEFLTTSVLFCSGPVCSGHGRGVRLSSRCGFGSLFFDPPAC